ncbi:cytidylyltransferase domain-containing protein [Roseibium aggregatum]|uniref:N-acylneuraminate cytidylyltransferase n=1 Tax=Roseibium aggregatum TaxID=187304 RepID=A0A926NYF9_9HYPH|nr:acylneuraminate cytidylyltransferase [Roseibium aggregatum]MBD1548689.1 acylneuraminate cytidylyltransferase [Roseibium aggregatum]
MTRVIAVIPARGGSRGLPGKNIRPLGGTPLVARTVDAALHAACIERVYVSSDDAGILKVARAAGAHAIVRPGEISGSTASSESALLHALEHLKAEQAGLPDILVFLQCTSPFTTAAEIDLVVDTMIQKNADSAFSVVEDHGFIWQEDVAGFAEGITHDHSKPRQRRQDMTPRYRENGAIYAMRVEPFLAEQTRFCGRTVLVPVSAPTIEIDTQEDWDMAEAFQASRKPASLRKEHVPGQIKAVVTDFDGVHTDDRVLVSQDGQEAVFCSRRDGMGLERLRDRGVRLLILSKEANPVVKTRAAKLKMPVQNHVDDKLSALEAWRAENGLEWSEIAYIGNDINDTACMAACGLAFSPADAHADALKTADIVLEASGGKGALREMSDYLIARQLVSSHRDG